MRTGYTATVAPCDIHLSSTDHHSNMGYMIFFVFTFGMWTENNNLVVCVT